jgi:hypothetical protein
MKDQEINIAIAESRGVNLRKWSYEHGWPIQTSAGHASRAAAADDIQSWLGGQSAADAQMSLREYQGKPPSYTTDLNAIHNVIVESDANYSIGLLDQILWESYEPKHLVSPLDKVKATAVQLCEWHLRTLNLWKS